MKHLTVEEKNQRITDVRNLKDSGFSLKEACNQIGISVQAYYSTIRTLSSNGVGRKKAFKKPQALRTFGKNASLRDSILDKVFKEGTRAIYDSLASQTW